MTNLHCATRHQLGAERVRNFSLGLGDRSTADRAEAWVERAAEDLAGSGNTTAGPDSAGGRNASLQAGWENIVQYMRWAMDTTSIANARPIRYEDTSAL